MLDWLSPLPPSSTGTSQFLRRKLGLPSAFQRWWWTQEAVCFLEFGQQKKGIGGSPGLCFLAQVTGSSCWYLGIGLENLTNPPGRQQGPGWCQEEPVWDGPEFPSCVSLCVL